MIRLIVSLSDLAAERRLKIPQGNSLGSWLLLCASLPHHNAGLEDHQYCSIGSPLSNGCGCFIAEEKFYGLLG